MLLGLAHTIRRVLVLIRLAEINLLTVRINDLANLNPHTVQSIYAGSICIH